MPVEEDFDDLDDVLDEFSKPKASTSKSVPPVPAANADPQDDELPEMDEAFLTELTKNMESLFSNNNAAGGQSGEMKAFLEAMMKDSGAEGEVDEQEIAKAMKDLDAQLGSVASGSSKAQPKKGASFQDAIKQTHDKMNASDASARVS